MTFLVVILLSSCGVENRRYTYINYLGLYNAETYFVLSDQWEEGSKHLYRFEDDEFVFVKEFKDSFITYFADGIVFSLSWNGRYANPDLIEYHIDTGETKEYTLPVYPEFGRIMGYHDGVLMFYSAGLQKSGDELLVLYSTITSEVTYEYDGLEIDLGYGVGDFDSEYIYLANERGNYSEAFEGVRINIETEEIETYQSPEMYVSYGYDDNQIFYTSQIADSNVAFINKDEVPTEFFTMYNDYKQRVYCDIESETFIFADNEEDTIDILKDGVFETYDVLFNDYSYGFINDTLYYTIDVKTYGSIYKREVAVIKIRAIVNNEVLYTSGNITISNQSKWEEN
jgi:hypothetical protein